MARKVLIKTISTIIILVALSVPSFEQDDDFEYVPLSPCPSVFQYETSTMEHVGPQRRWYGVIKLPTDVNIRSLRMNIVLDSKADILGNWIGVVTSKDNINFRVENATIDISAGAEEYMQFFVQHSPLVTAPRIRVIRLNGREICNADKQSPGAFQAPSSTMPSNPVQTRPNDFTGQMQCGKVAIKVAPLILNGVATSEGQWPWQIALYHLRKLDHIFQCGGTLVSRQHVITAAHCVTRKSGTKVNHDTLSVHLGKHSLRASHAGVQIAEVSNVIVHPDFNKYSAYSRDVAILVLQETVTLTNWVQPACLWPETMIDIQYVVGRRGSVVGWGLDATGEMPDNLNLVEMPVIDELTCVRSYREFFTQFSPEYTYCAGYLNGSSVCLGDSGGGMVFNNAGTWYLRGLVSLSLAGQGKYRCDPTHYIIFTDLAKFMPWIKQYIK